jgi:hypothetical protein
LWEHRSEALAGHEFVHYRSRGKMHAGEIHGPGAKIPV